MKQKILERKLSLLRCFSVGIPKRLQTPRKMHQRPFRRQVRFRDRRLRGRRQKRFHHGQRKIRRKVQFYEIQETILCAEIKNNAVIHFLFRTRCWLHIFRERATNTRRIGYLDCP